MVKEDYGPFIRSYFLKLYDGIILIFFKSFFMLRNQRGEFSSQIETSRALALLETSLCCILMLIVSMATEAY